MIDAGRLRLGWMWSRVSTLNTQHSHITVTPAMAAKYSTFMRALARSYATLSNSAARKRYAFSPCIQFLSDASAQQVCQSPCSIACLGFLMLVSFSDCDAQHGRSIHGMLLCLETPAPRCSFCHHQSRSPKPTTF